MFTAIASTAASMARPLPCSHCGPVDCDRSGHNLFLPRGVHHPFRLLIRPTPLSKWMSCRQHHLWACPTWLASRIVVWLTQSAPYVTRCTLLDNPVPTAIPPPAMDTLMKYPDFCRMAANPSDARGVGTPLLHPYILCEMFWSSFTYHGFRYQ